MPPAHFSMPPGRLMPTTTVSTPFKLPIRRVEDRFSDAAGEYQIALSNLPKGLAEGPLYAIELRLNLYELDLRADDQTRARQQLDLAGSEIQQVQMPSASRAEMLRLRAAIESASGRLDAANADLKEALTLAPSNVNSLLNYAI